MSGVAPFGRWCCAGDGAVGRADLEGLARPVPEHAGPHVGDRRGTGLPGESVCQLLQHQQ